MKYLATGTFSLRHGAGLTGRRLQRISNLDNEEEDMFKRLINRFCSKKNEDHRKPSQHPRYMDIKEFRESGYLQELNRQFLHPLGLALEIIIDDETGEEKLGGIWDCRDKPEGIYFDYDNRDYNQIIKAIVKMAQIEHEFRERSEAREILFGDMIEPINPSRRISPDALTSDVACSSIISDVKES